MIFQMTDMIAWSARLYDEAVDQKDADGFAAVFTDDAWMRFGNNDPITGRENIRQAIAGFFTLFQSLKHESTGTTWADGTLVVEANVTYTLFDGRTVTVPASTIMRIADPSAATPQVRKCQMYVDLGPLFSAIQTPA
jgi:hypothetical protein